VLEDVRRKGLVDGFKDTNKDEGSWIRKKKKYIHVCNGERNIVVPHDWILEGLEMSWE
jgi:hypothetical protein